MEESHFGEASCRVKITACVILLRRQYKSRCSNRSLNSVKKTATFRINKSSRLTGDDAWVKNKRLRVGYSKSKPCAQDRSLPPSVNGFLLLGSGWLLPALYLQRVTFLLHIFLSLPVFHGGWKAGAGVQHSHQLSLSPLVRMLLSRCQNRVT